MLTENTIAVFSHEYHSCKARDRFGDIHVAKYSNAVGTSSTVSPEIRWAHKTPQLLGKLAHHFRWHALLWAPWGQRGGLDKFAFHTCDPIRLLLSRQMMCKSLQECISNTCSWRRGKQRLKDYSVSFSDGHTHTHTVKQIFTRISSKKIEKVGM